MNRIVDEATGIHLESKYSGAWPTYQTWRVTMGDGVTVSLSLEGHTHPADFAEGHNKHPGNDQPFLQITKVESEFGETLWEKSNGNNAAS